MIIAVTHLDSKRPKTRSKSKHSKSRKQTKPSPHPLTQRANSVDHQCDSTLKLCKQVRKDLHKLASNTLSAYFRKCKAEEQNRRVLFQRTGSVDMQGMY